MDHHEKKHVVEGVLLELSIIPGEQLLGVMVIAADGEQEGRYMRRPENTYSSIMIDGKGVGSLSLLIEAIMGGEYMVKWSSEMTVDFTKQAGAQRLRSKESR